MSNTWASVVTCPKPPPTPADRWEALIETYDTKPLRLVALEVLGLLEVPLAGNGSIAVPLVEHCKVVGVDTEAWTANTDEMTEIGMVIAEYKDGKALNGEVGEYAEELLKRMKYHHLRIWENAHLKTNAEWMRGAEGNHFGQSRFVTFAETRAILDEVLDEPIVSDNPDLAGLKRPIILVGHALAHDKDNLQKNGLNYDFKKHGTVVKEIDTQRLTKEVHAWLDKQNPNNDIGLDTLCKDVFGFEHTDAHTALNDAARTVICMVNLALRSWFLKDKTEKTMQEVVLEVEKHSQHIFSSTWGTQLCCTRCGSREHSNKEGQCEIEVHCRACERFDEPTEEVTKQEIEKYTHSHIEQCCPHIAEFNAWKRRVLDAHRKRNTLPPGPPPASHPLSSWRGRWPMTSASDVLVPQRPKTPPFLRPDYRLPVMTATSAPIPGVKIVATQSTGRARAEKAKRDREQKERENSAAVGSVTKKSGRSSGADDAWNGTAW
jgi:hypothetical protein